MSLENYTISTDKEQLNCAYIHHYLSTESYWAKNIPYHIVEKSISGSLCFGVYHHHVQVGFARIITDHATFGYLADVFIDKDHRGKGLSKELMRFIMAHESVKLFRNFLLATLDAHTLYEKFGFKALKEPGRFMSIKFFEHY